MSSSKTTNSIKEALDTYEHKAIVRMRSNARTLADMSESEILLLEARYGAKVAYNPDPRPHIYNAYRSDWYEYLNSHGPETVLHNWFEQDRLLREGY